jgi:hypothetical protein
MLQRELKFLQRLSLQCLEFGDYLSAKKLVDNLLDIGVESSLSYDVCSKLYKVEWSWV